MRSGIPSGKPPRACLAYSFIAQLFILSRYGLIDDGFVFGIEEAITHLNNEEKKIIKEAKRIAKKLNKKIPVIYTAANMEAVAGLRTPAVSVLIDCGSAHRTG